MEIEKLIEWNPWWEKKNLLNELKGIERPEYKSLINSTKISEITIITGVRRSGKSTLMYQMVDSLLKKGINPEQILFVNFDDKQLFKDNLDDIYQTYRTKINLDKKAFIFFDEVHRKKDWEHWIRKKYDLKTNNKFIISGSCSYLLKKEYSSLLTGRNLTFEVFPLSFDEFLFFNNVTINKSKIKRDILLENTKLQILKYLDEYLEQGGFPEIVLKSSDYKTKILKQYFDDILYKDIIGRYNIDTQKSRDLALYLITNFTNTISLRSLRNSLGLSYDTIKEYLAYFKEAFLLFSLDHFSYSFKEQKTLASKIYCIDNGLRNSTAFRFSKDYGRLAENIVFLSLIKKNKEIYYWKAKEEVDFVVKNKDLTAINVTYTDVINPREIKSLLKFRQLFKTKKLILITKDVYKEEKGVKYIPLWRWLLS